MYPKIAYIFQETSHRNNVLIQLYHISTVVYEWKHATVQQKSEMEKDIVSRWACKLKGKSITLFQVIYKTKTNYSAEERRNWNFYQTYHNS